MAADWIQTSPGCDINSQGEGTAGGRGRGGGGGKEVCGGRATANSEHSNSDIQMLSAE